MTLVFGVGKFSVMVYYAIAWPDGKGKEESKRVTSIMNAIVFANLEV